MRTPFTVIIPARFASTRLPGKPLLDIQGQPMIQRVWEQVKKSDAKAIIIATDHEDIAKVAQDFGADVCMTDESHVSGTDRLQEVTKKLGLSEQEIIVNVQGDEPLIPPAVINQVAALIASKNQPMATLYEKIMDIEQLFDPNVVKVVTSQTQEALYFSRAPAPWDRDSFIDGRQESEVTDFKRHVGLYAYRVALLNQFVKWPCGALESIEKLEQLRVLEHGMRIAIDEAQDVIPAGIDTQADLDRVNALLARGE